MQAEELASLVRGNLHAKHLLLSIEDLFVKFLECPQSEEDGKLALEPMESYQRMLLHRLADLFGLAHESVDEGEYRHLVVEKCEDSLIPEVLVSDVLFYESRDTQIPLVSRQLLKRNTTARDGSETPPASNASFVSLEERQATYLAARQRIFTASWKYEEEAVESMGIPRPKSNPAVARRMIAHALGKGKVFASDSPATGVISPQDLDLEFLDRGVSAKSRADRSGNEGKIVSVEVKESMQQSSAVAAKRLFANALGSSHSRRSLTAHQASSKTSPGRRLSIPGEDITLEGALPSGENLTGVPHDSSDNVSRVCRHGSTNSLGTHRKARPAQPGSAACRIFAQALGLPDPIYPKP